MNKPLKILAFVALMTALSGIHGCKRSDMVSEADVLGTWEVKSWVSSDARFKGCDMLGTLVFSAMENHRLMRVDFTFACGGIPETAIGYASLADPNLIRFEIGYMGRGVGFDGFVEDGRMIGRLGGEWGGLVSYNDGDWWEAVKK
jgi:hypothetical protein